MLKEKVIEPTQNEWASSVVFVPKKKLDYTFLRRLPEAKLHNREILLSLTKMDDLI